LIDKAKCRLCPDGYVEKHHILPRSLGGSDDSSNLVTLTSREHFVAHMLLAKIHGGVMWQALIIMKKGKYGYKRYINSRLFEVARKKAGPEREAAIKKKRTENSDFDAHMHSVRSNATKNRKEGYQKSVAEIIAKKAKEDPAYEARMKEGKRKAQAASSAKVRAQSELLVAKIHDLRADGMLYKEIAEEINRSQAFVCNIVKGKMYNYMRCENASLS
jgi:hypothetical protein